MQISMALGAGAVLIPRVLHAKHKLGSAESALFGVAKSMDMTSSQLLPTSRVKRRRWLMTGILLSTLGVLL